MNVGIDIDFEGMNFNLDLGIDIEFPLLSNVDIEFECIVKINILDILILANNIGVVSILILVLSCI